MADTALRITFSDGHLGVAGDDFEYIFSYQHGGPVSIRRCGIEWLYRAPRPAFWRATTDNDKGNGFSLDSSMWLGADAFIRVVGAEVSVDGKTVPLPMPPENNKYSGEEKAEEIKITHVFKTTTSPATDVYVSYEVNRDGRITVSCLYKGFEALPDLPVFGLRMIMPTKASGYKYEGLSGETYPDRMDGAQKGIFEVQGLPMSAYLVPQENGLHMDTESLEIYRNTSLDNSDDSDRVRTLRIVKKDKPFPFSILPYTPMELESATHKEELPPARRTVLTIYGAVRGVGGIDSWGADVEEKYHVSASEDIAFSFVIEP